MKKKKKIKISRLITLILVLAIIILAIWFVLKGISKLGDKIVDNIVEENLESAEKIEEEDEPEPDITITLTAIGDIMCHNTQYQDAYDSETRNI